MHKSKRQKGIAEYIYEHKEATVSELSSLFDVSQVTMRKDLAELESEGAIFKVHGGATQREHLLVNEIPYHKKNLTALEEKKSIGKIAASFINQNNVIFMDNGSTTNEIVSYMDDMEIVVVTNDVRIAYRLAMFPSMNIIMSGGYIKSGGYSILGSEAEQLFGRTLADVCFLAVDSIDIDFGISFNNMAGIQTKKNMIHNSEKVIAVCDSSKMGKRSLAKLCDISDIDMLITDKIEDSLRLRFKEAGVEVVTP